MSSMSLFSIKSYASSVYLNCNGGNFVIDFEHNYETARGRTTASNIYINNKEVVNYFKNILPDLVNHDSYEKTQMKQCCFR